MGYKKLQKFLEHKEARDELGGKVPLAYLEAIGVEGGTLDYSLELVAAF